MLLDLESPDTPSSYDADVCIVGAGAAGITLARALIGSGIDVLLLEAGGLTYDEESQKIYDATVDGLRYYPSICRLRYFGGTTNHWEGWCGPMPRQSIGPRPWMPRSGWPLSADELDTYYRLACEVLSLGAYDFLDHQAVLPAEALTPAGAPFFDSFYLKQSQPRRLGEVYRQELVDAPNVRILLHANVLPIQADGRSIRELTVSTFANRTAKVRARVYVIACGALENARLLLASNNLANSSDAVGRYFMDHLFSTVAGAVVPAADYRDPNAFKAKVHPDPVAALRISDQAQRELGLLNCGVWTSPVYVPESLRLPGVRSINEQYPVLVMGEQCALPDSRVTLDPAAVDRFNVPRLKVTWKVDDQAQQTVRRALLSYAGMIARSGVGRVFIEPMKSEIDWPFALVSPCHSSGTTRMSSDPREGVVNGDCRAHDIDNLYIVGSSVFPTIAEVNPTMTIIALALRLADELKSVVRPSGTGG